jgi:hypothetical protein
LRTTGFNHINSAQKTTHLSHREIFPPEKSKMNTINKILITKTLIDPDRFNA